MKRFIQQASISLSRGQHNFSKMPPKKEVGKQTNISSFFSKAEKRQRSKNDSSDPAKQMKINSNESTSMISSLSPEQQRRIDEKREEALLKLNKIESIGGSWKKALEKEFEKPYFTKACVMKFFVLFHFTSRHCLTNSGN